MPRVARAFGVLCGVAAVCIAEPASAQQSETLNVVSTFRGKPLNVATKLFLPENRGATPIPAMIVMHGSGGVRARELAYAREFTRLGIAAVVIDSFAARGIRSTVRDQSQVASRDMLFDVAATLKAAARHPAIDPGRIGLIGFSKGGTVVVKAALRKYAGRLFGDEAFAVLIAVYPWCGDQPLDFTPANNAKLHMLLGGADRYVGVESCKEYADKLKARGGNVELKIYPNAPHDWDVPDPPQWRDAAGENMSQCVYDEVAEGTWVERKSGIKVMEDNKPTGKSKEALAHCMTRGVSGGYSRDAHAQSSEDIRNYLRTAFRLSER